MSVLCALKSCPSWVRASLIPVRGPWASFYKSVRDQRVCWMQVQLGVMTRGGASLSAPPHRLATASHANRRERIGEEEEAEGGKGGGGKGGKARASDSGILNLLTLTLYLAHRPPLPLRKTAAALLMTRTRMQVASLMRMMMMKRTRQSDRTGGGEDVNVAASEHVVAQTWRRIERR